MISDVLGEMFDLCMAADTSGDGSGCDNMTALVVRLRNRAQNSKRPRSDDENEAQPKARGYFIHISFYILQGERLLGTKRVPL